MNLIRIVGVLLGLVVAAGCSTTASPHGGDVQVKIIAFNDYHGHLEPSDSLPANAPGSDRRALGGAAYLAAHVAALKRQNPLHAVVGAGDVIGASPLISGAFHDEPAVETLNRIGLEFNAVGNHEFDKGLPALLRLQQGGCALAGGQPDPRSCQGATAGTPVPFEGAAFRWLGANVFSHKTGRPVLPAYGIKDFDGVRVAFIGLTLKGTGSIVSPGLVADLEFRDEADTVNALVPVLREQGIEAIVVLLHEGGVQTGGMQDINACEGRLAGSPLAAIVARLDDAVDLVVSGHTHAAYRCRLPNAAQRNIPVTSSGSYGRIVADIDLTIRRGSRDVVAVGAQNRWVTHDSPGIEADEKVAHIVAAYRHLLTPVTGRVLGAIAHPLPATRDRACNMPAGNIVADAQLQMTRAPAEGGAQIAFMNGGGVRLPGFAQGGNITYGDAFAAQPFGNRLVTMTLTAQEIKTVLESQFAGCDGQSPHANRLLLPSAGFSYVWDGGKACGSRISQVSLRTDSGLDRLVDESGVVLQPERLYRVTVNDYLADGGDGFATFRKGRDRQLGMIDVDALAAFLVRYRAPAPPYDPRTVAADAGRPRLQRADAGRSCPTGAAVLP